MQPELHVELGTEEKPPRLQLLKSCRSSVQERGDHGASMVHGSFSMEAMTQHQTLTTWRRHHSGDDGRDGARGDDL